MIDTPTRQDIVNCYRLALGRDPESEAVIEDKLVQPRSGLLPDFFCSAEFNEGARRDVVEGSTARAVFRLPPDPEIRDWAAGFAPLSAGSLEPVRTSASWAELYLALFSDEVFAATVLDDAARALNPALLSALAIRIEAEAASRIEGRIELITPHEIRGWALDHVDPDRRLRLELWIDGVFRTATAPDRYRPELQARFGGGGVFGFTMLRPREPRGSGPVQAELREARSGIVVDILDLPALDGPPLDAAVALRHELAGVRALLARIEGRLPDVSEAYSFDLDLYGDYFDACYAPLHVATVPSAPLPNLVAILDATDVGPAELEAVLAGLARQRRAPGQVVVSHPGGELRLDFEHALSLWRGRFQDPRSPRGVLADDGWAPAVRLALGETQATHILLADARGRLAPDAAERMDSALERGAALVYADSDTAERLPGGGLGRHCDPVLRTAFDAELFLQQGDLGPLLGVTRRVLETTDWGDVADPYGLVLQAMGRGAPGGFVHIPRVLSHLAAPAGPVDTAARAAALDAHLALHHPGARVTPHADALGASVPGALRVRRPLLPAARAAVIVPTRDRLDLLEPCLESLATTAEQNRTALEVLVVDNRSREPETAAALQRFARRLTLRVIPHDGVFNWSLINNRAATETDADVLIFLNNDTAVLTADWCDELCSEALRPEVGAVGARLLYADGTIQHAGVVAGGVHAFAAHEGVGAPGRDPGYLGRHALLREVSAVTGACLATRRSVFTGLGGFDASGLPVESNDIDYCFRLRAAGLKVLYDPYCTLYHYESKSRGPNVDRAKWRAAEAAGALMRARWGEAYRADPFYNPHFDRTSAPLTRLRPTSPET